jgi:hypothetical protein
MKNRFFFFAVLLATSFGGWAQKEENCWTERVQKGHEFFGKEMFKEAMEWYEYAKECEYKPLYSTDSLQYYLTRCQQQIENQMAEIQLTLPPGKNIVSADGETIMITVESGSDWRPESDQPDWCVVAKRDEKTIMVFCEANENTTDREATITIINQKVKQSVKLFQAHKTFITLTANTLGMVSFNGGEVIFDIASDNNDWTFSCRALDNAYDNAIVCEKRGDKVAAIIDANFQKEQHRFEITVTSTVNTALSAKKVIVQEGRDLSLTFNPPLMEFGTERSKERQLLTLESRIAASGISLDKQSVPAWCKIIYLSGKEYEISVEANTGYITREAQLLFKVAGNPEPYTYHVLQKGQELICTLEDTVFMFPAKTKKKHTATLDFECAEPLLRLLPAPGWVKTSLQKTMTSTGMGYSLAVLPAKNPNTEIRSTHLILPLPDSTKRIISIQQGAGKKPCYGHFYARAGISVDFSETRYLGPLHFTIGFTAKCVGLWAAYHDNFNLYKMTCYETEYTRDETGEIYYDEFGNCYPYEIEVPYSHRAIVGGLAFRLTRAYYWEIGGGYGWINRTPGYEIAYNWMFRIHGFNFGIGVLTHNFKYWEIPCSIGFSLGGWNWKRKK